MSETNTSQVSADGPAVPALLRIPGGVFLMGMEERRPDEAPVRQVHINPFLLAASPVTNAEYRKFIEASGHPEPPFWDDERLGAPGQPVVGISWHDAVAYCDWLTRHSGELRYRLPTEAEREYAALGGLEQVDWPWGTASEADHPRYADIDAADRPHPPYPECANGYGLHCMAENVHEWCSDWYAKDAYLAEAGGSPTGPVEGKRKVSRGGSWRHSNKFTRVTARASLDPTFRYNDFGFRVAATEA